MSYRCSTCKAAQPPRTARSVHQVLRTDGSILRELAVCKSCQARLAGGTSAEEVGRQAAGLVVPEPPPLNRRLEGRPTILFC